MERTYKLFIGQILVEHSIPEGEDGNRKKDALFERRRPEVKQALREGKRVYLLYYDGEEINV